MLNKIPEFLIVGLTELKADVVQRAINVRSSPYNAVEGGIIDATNAIQAAIDACPVNGIVTGVGKTYLVSKLNLKSDMTFENFNFITKASDDTNDFFSPVTIGNYEVTDTISNVTIKNVHVDGNRTNQTNITGAENGGRHGFRLIGNVYNIMIENCSALYCASDGIAMYSGIGTRSAPQAGLDTCLINNVTIRDCIFNYNRRHGGSGDSIDSLFVDNCSFDYNGIDINSGVTEGDRGDLSGGLRYGNGFDMEGYGIGSLVQNIEFHNCTALDNARHGIVFLDTVNQSLPAFVTRNNIRIVNVKLNKGQYPVEPYCISFTSTIANKANASLYKNIALSNCTFINEILLRSVDSVTFDGGYASLLTGQIGTLDHATSVTVGSTLRGTLAFYTDTSTVTYLSNFNPRLQGTVTIASGATWDTGRNRNATLGLITIALIGGSPSGGAFATEIYLNGGSGATVHAIYNGAQVTTQPTATGALQIVDNITNWSFKNTSLVSYTISYLLI